MCPFQSLTDISVGDFPVYCISPEMRRGNAGYPVTLPTLLKASFIPLTSLTIKTNKIFIDPTEVTFLLSPASKINFRKCAVKCAVVGTYFKINCFVKLNISVLESTII